MELLSVAKRVETTHTLLLTSSIAGTRRVITNNKDKQLANGNENVIKPLDKDNANTKWSMVDL